MCRMLQRLLVIVVVLCATLAWPVAAAARTVQALETWRFQRADVPQGPAPALDDTGWATVRLPHTWNAEDGEAGGSYHRGAAWYRTRLATPAPTAGRRHFLEFDGAALSADVWVNGRWVGRHEGGYARFRFDVTDALLPTGENLLAVRVDNAWQASVSPLGGDFTIFGGLYRGVRLVSTAAVHLDMLDHGGPGLQVRVLQATAQQARLQVTARVRNDDHRPQRMTLRLSLQDPQGRRVLQQQRPLQATAGSTQALTLDLQVARPQRWQGVHHPARYRLVAELLQQGRVQDTVDLPVGLRQVAVDARQGLLLNGQPYPLYGVNYFHPGRPGQGVAVTEADIDEDFRLLRELGVTGLRLVHYQHPPYVYELADRHGFVLWTEVPLNSAMDDSPVFRANLGQQLLELMRQTGHHAAVAVWGLGNEVYRSDAPIVALLRSLHLQAKAEDPLRPTAYAHCCAPDDHPMALQADLTGFNRYIGWYDGDLADFGRWADRVQALLPGRPLGLGEYGAGASVLQQEDPPRRVLPNSAWHPEQFQALFHEAYWRALAGRSGLWGSFVWLGFDHASDRRNEGDRAGINDKGLVTYDRQVTKDAFHYYRAQWSATPMAYITSRRHTPRPAGTVAVKVYTNGRSATLSLNGQTLGEAPVQGGIARWPAVVLPPGRHTLSVRTDHGATDTLEWTTRP